MRTVVLLLAGLVGGCVTTDEPASPVASESTAANDEKRCPLDDASCSEISSDPSYCYLSEYSGVALESGHTLRSRGRNICVAKASLSQKICFNKFQQAKLGRVICVPDPSVGECPPQLPQCDKKLAQEFHCYAKFYSGEKILPQNYLFGQGGSECAAKNDLQLLACRRLLRPSLISDVSCGASLVSDECGSQPKKCSKSYQAFVCQGEFQGGVLAQSQLISVAGENECLAQRNLHKMACQLNIKSSEILQKKCQKL